jgi:hypothetical protein
VDRLLDLLVLAHGRLLQHFGLRLLQEVRTGEVDLPLAGGSRVGRLFGCLAGVRQVDVLEAEGGLQQLQLHRNQDRLLQLLRSLPPRLYVHCRSLQTLDVLLAQLEVFLDVEDALRLRLLFEARP